MGKLYMFRSGILESTKDKFTLGVGADVEVEVPVPYFFYDTEDHNILIDAGDSPGVVDDPKETWGDISDVYWPVMEEEELPVNTLRRELDVEPEDVDYILLTHMHLDHAGSLKKFPNAEIIVQLKEIRYAWHPDPLMAGAYIVNDFKDESLNYNPIGGLRYLFDGKIWCIPTYGHVPGHQSFMVEDEEHGNLILTGDAIYMKENLTENIPPGLGCDMGEAMKKAEMLQELADSVDGQIVFGHDPDEFYKWQKKLSP